MRTSAFLAGLLVFTAAAVCGPMRPQAAELTGTLKKIKEKGVIVLGHRETSIPFSYYNNDHQVVGFSQDIAIKIVDAIKTELRVQKIETRLIPITSQTRIPLLLNNTIDLECGTTSNTAERWKQVAFSLNYFTIGTRLLTRKDSGIKDFEDLRGKNVVVSAGTTSERILRKMNEDKKMEMSVISAKDHGEAFVTLDFRKAVAFMSDDAILYGEKTKAKTPDDWHIVGAAQSNEVYACMLRRDDPSFKEVVDGALRKMMQGGEMTNLYGKWFLSPIPPRGINLNVPMNADLAALYRTPNDKPL